eukprot:6633597-Karenia_brevis.AAC.1
MMSETLPLLSQAACRQTKELNYTLWSILLRISAAVWTYERTASMYLMVAYIIDMHGGQQVGEC